MVDVLSLDNPVFRNFAFYATICILKTMFMIVLTGRQRNKKGVPATPEDAWLIKSTGEKSDLTRGSKDPDVERVRRNHLNDLENIPLFVLLGFIYLFTHPDPQMALWHFRAFTAARIGHTVAFQLPLPQPARGVFFMAGLITMLSMAYQIIAATY